MLSFMFLLLLPRHSLSVLVISLISFSKLTHTTFHLNLPTNCSISARFVQFPAPFCYSPHHLLSAHPSSILLHYIFPRRFPLSTLLTTQSKLPPLSHKLSSFYSNYIISATFTLNHHSFLNFANIQPHFYSHPLHHLFILLFLIFCNIS